MLEALTDADPTDAGWQRDLAEALHGRGLALIESGDLECSSADAEAALRITARLLQSTAEKPPRGTNQQPRACLDRPGVAATWRGDPRTRRVGTVACCHCSRREGSDEYQFLEPLALALLGTGQGALAGEVIRKLEGMGFHSPRLSEAAAASGRTAPSLRPAS